MKTIPHRLIITGLAYYKSSTSNTKLKLLGNFIISPELKHNFLLSSNTVFKFSIHKVSTGPSKTIQLMSFLSSLQILI